jgi:hypothetical protein
MNRRVHTRHIGERSLDRENFDAARRDLASNSRGGSGQRIA